ncbi:MAG: sensor histidine kinase [Solirubrobacteraceae bacterium]
MNRPRLTVRARVTLLNTGLFALCGAIVVAVSYVLVAQLGPSGQSQPQRIHTDVPARVQALCRSAKVERSPEILARCRTALQLQGARSQRALTLSHLLEYSLITVGVVLALAAILGWIAAGRALRPVHQITAAARAASERNLSARVAATGPRDELRELAETFDEMLGRLQTAFESQQRFIANASHELRTPLAVMRATVDVVLGNPDSTPDDLRGMAADIRAAVDDAERLIGALLILARNERGLTVRDQVDLATVAEDVIEAVGLGERRLHAELEPAVVSGDPLLLERLIANLVDNAIRYGDVSGEIRISTRTLAAGGQLTVANTGAPIAAAEAERIFEPFQRLRERTAHEGFGLGLAIVASIAVIHGGIARANPLAEGGLAVTVTIPTAARAAYSAGAEPGLTSPIS